MEWIKALHVISVIAWMAGMLYLPRLFVYHCDVEHGSPHSDMFVVMERRLLGFIMMPAMIASWVFGLWLVFGYGAVSPGDGWAWVKGVMIIAMTGMHHYFGRCYKAFAAGRNRQSARFFRVLNEVPTLIMIIIVIMVVVKPF